jgi:DNA-binding GntR family transcriptional regulator
MAELEAIIDKMANVGNAAETAYAVLREAIVTNTLKPGTRLRADDLAGQLGVSKTPVREALRKLQAESLVTVQPGNVLTVKSISEQELLQIYYTREALEGMAARLAAENATPSEIAQIRELLDDMEIVAQRGDLGALRRLSGVFHQLICRAAHNDRLLQSLRGLLDHVRQMQTSTLYEAGRSADALEEYRALLQAIEARDADRAEALARKHRRRTLTLRKDMLREQLRRGRAEDDGGGGSGA